MKLVKKSQKTALKVKLLVLSIAFAYLANTTQQSFAVGFKLGFKPVSPVSRSCSSPSTLPLVGNFECLSSIDEIIENIRLNLEIVGSKRLALITEYFTDSIQNGSYESIYKINPWVDPLRNRNSFIDTALKSFFYDTPLKQGRERASRSFSDDSLDKKFESIVHICLLMKRLVEIKLAKSDIKTQTFIIASYASGATAALLRWGLPLKRIAKQLLRCDKYTPPWDIMETVRQGKRVACIEYVTLTKYLLESCGVMVERGATLFGTSNPFINTPKLSPFASSMFAHNFIYVIIGGVYYSIDPLRRNFDQEGKFIIFPIYQRTHFELATPFIFLSILTYNYAIPIIQYTIIYFINIVYYMYNMLYPPQFHNSGEL